MRYQWNFRDLSIFIILCLINFFRTILGMTLNGYMYKHAEL